MRGGGYDGGASGGSGCGAGRSGMRGYLDDGARRARRGTGWDGDGSLSLIYISLWDYMEKASICRCLRFSLRVSADFMLSGGRAFGSGSASFFGGDRQDSHVRRVWECAPGS